MLFSVLPNGVCFFDATGFSTEVALYPGIKPPDCFDFEIGQR
jgi:hypothetical protein